MPQISMPKIFLIGAGPGDPDLLTLKAHRLIMAADAILYDSLVDPRILAIAQTSARLIDVGKRCGGRSTAQAQICKLLVAEAQTGTLVVRLKGGDPMIFGRATEEMSALDDAGIDYEIVPGITTATAAAASLRLSLTQRRIARSLHFLTGHGAEGGLPAHDWVSLTKSGGTLVVYMGGKVLGGLATHFIEAGMAPDMPAIAIENVSLPSQQTIAGTIATLPMLLGRASLTGPVLIMIGEALGGAVGAQTIDEAHAGALAVLSPLP